MLVKILLAAVLCINANEHHTNEEQIQELSRLLFRLKRKSKLRALI